MFNYNNISVTIIIDKTDNKCTNDVYAIFVRVYCIYETPFITSTLTSPMRTKRNKKKKRRVCKDVQDLLYSW